MDLILFAGDMISSGNCYAFGGLGIPINLVYGKNDSDRISPAREFSSRGSEYLGDFGEIDPAGFKIALLHGIEETLVRAERRRKKESFMV